MIWSSNKLRLFGVFFFVGVAVSLTTLLRPVVIRRGADGFRPNNITILSGQAVIFVNDTSGPVWPASDFHPLHSLYPEFDPKREVAAGETYAFRFGRSGTWGFHDHLKPEFTGSVTVIASDNENCRALGSAGDPKQLVACWGREIEAELEKSGFDTAYGKFRDLYAKETGFAANCHDVMHIFGRAAYGKFKKGESFEALPDVTVCAYGFYHGFMEAILARGGAISEARTFCETVGKEKGVSFILACYHGLGHAAFDTMDPALWGDAGAMADATVAVCRQLSGEPYKLDMCAKGLFNSINKAYEVRDYKLVFPVDDPFALCRREKDPFRAPCFGEMLLSAVHHSGFAPATDFRRALTIASGIDDAAGAKEAVLYAAADAARAGTAEARQGLLASCHTLPERNRLDCVKGIVQGTLMVGRPKEEALEALPICQTGDLSESERKLCYDRLFDFAVKVYEKEGIAGLCRVVPERYRQPVCDGI